MAELRPVVLATGGTGGHVFPAEALAGELEARGLPFTLVTDARGRQWQGALSRRPIHYIRSASPTGSLRRRLMALFSLGLGLFDAWRALGRIGPAAVVGFGGYASVPTMIAARLRRTPAIVHEQNAVLGKANRWVLGGVSKVATSFPVTRGLESDPRARMVGNPVRDAVRVLRGSPYRAPGPDLVIDLLVFAGSQGAASFSQVIPQAILSLPAALRARLRLVQQCRTEDIERVRAMYAQSGIVAELAPFFADMPQRLAGAHLVIARSGASTVAELAAVGRPSILVPYPFHTDQHQVVNARALEAAGAAVLMHHATFTAETLSGHLRALFEAPQRLVDMAAAAHAAGRPDAAARLADLVGELIATPSLSPSGVAA
ncbi:MAG: undecaprenyldiphospho-muramoylpentapeptide beta-N-acetylglucosaminyltransferase [Alphaproteobacteria bacterium]|jgi:UDP-N-acetylglucosamine--N-acetylmuramyl-(pentapeptide) pyrophosphoryl-undecaprenol N-acetylglucosamine transferase